MSNFRDALEAQLVCPKCGAENIPGRSPTVHLEDGGLRAGCDQCGQDGPIETFVRKR